MGAHAMAGAQRYLVFTPTSMQMRRGPHAGPFELRVHVVPEVSVTRRRVRDLAVAASRGVAG